MHQIVPGFLMIIVDSAYSVTFHKLQYTNTLINNVMTIFINMATLSIADTQLLKINKDLMVCHNHQQQQRQQRCKIPPQTSHPHQDQRKQRSERASSLALPPDSLLDFYDYQQKQCSSVALLPVNANGGVTRRHSSHCYPTLEDASQQKPLLKQHETFSSISRAKAPTDVADVKGLHRKQSSATVPSKPGNIISINNQASVSLLNWKCQHADNIKNSTKSAIIADICVTGKIQKPSLSLPPPPVPKRTFHGKFTLNNLKNVMTTSAELTSATTKQILAERKQQPTIGMSFSYSQQQPLQIQAQLSPQTQDSQKMHVKPLSDNDFCATYTSNDGQISKDQMRVAPISLLPRLSSRTLLTAAIAANDAGAISDDDRMSLENSVFEESLNTTPVRFTSGKLCSSTVAIKSFSAISGSAEFNFISKRSNLSSSSTIDSSGYMSHNERLTSTSTNPDFRSRFSSVDTQSSFDSSAPEKLSVDLSLNTNGSGHQQDDDNNYSNSTIYNKTRTINQSPAVPLRKQFNDGQKKITNFDKTVLSNAIANAEGKSVMTVSNSASTSSTTSAGSSISTDSSNSMSVSGAGNSPLISLPQSEISKRAIPPVPPVRISNQTLQLMDSTENRATNPVSLTTRNKLMTNLQRTHNSNVRSELFVCSFKNRDKNLKNSSLLQNALSYDRSTFGMDANASRSSAKTTTDSSSQTPPKPKHNCRQDSTISSDSFSQTSNPSYNTKLLEAPLLPTTSMKQLCSVSNAISVKQKFQNETIDEMLDSVPLSPLTKCVSTPASLQTIVRFQNGSPNTMSLPHQVINHRKSSNPYITNGRLKFRLFQILINALALLVIAGGFAAYFNAYPTIKFINKTIINTVHVEDSLKYGKNPAPGTCLPIIVKFCKGPHIPYNFTVFPNYIGHFGQLETQVDLDAYEALVEVHCYELVSLFLCTLFVPKCGASGSTVAPCKSLCTETMRRCGFFFDVFGLSLPEYLNCKLFKDFESPEDCVGFEQVREIMIAYANPKCEGFQCDHNRCIPDDYVCDGHLDCMDQMDEANCEKCSHDEIHCGREKCISSKHICDGIVDCPYGQDERNCIRLSERNGDFGKGVLEVYRISSHEWSPACVKNWDRAISPMTVCSMLGYNSVNATNVITQKTHRPLLTSVNISDNVWKMYAKKRSNLIQQLSSCQPDEDYPIAELTCSNYECGKIRKVKDHTSTRIVGGIQVSPGSWPFLAAILGGPERIFYCAGVLISDQWILTASHCIGNHTVIDLDDWTVQLGVTRRNSFTYSGQKVKVKAVIPHPLYNVGVAHDNDIALFQLSTRVAFHEHLLPVCLPPTNMKQLKAESLCMVIGWGKREDRKDPKITYEHIVNEVQVPVIRRQLCEEWLENYTVSEGMICAGYEDGGKDACQGDSGGPLLCPYPGEKDKWFVGGIVSWGINCANPKLPGVYANVVKYVPWILEQIQKHARPLNDEKTSKHDFHRGGPHIALNMATTPGNVKTFHKIQNQSPMNVDYYHSEEMSNK
ncbi:corin serine peptidase isoform 3-T3 [Glossina fuscipes fuscipes]